VARRWEIESFLPQNYRVRRAVGHFTIGVAAALELYASYLKAGAMTAALLRRDGRRSRAAGTEGIYSRRRPRRPGQCFASVFLART